MRRNFELEGMHHPYIATNSTVTGTMDCARGEVGNVYSIKVRAEVSE